MSRQGKMIRLEPELHARLQVLSQRTMVPMSALLGKAVERYLDVMEHEGRLERLYRELGGPPRRVDG